MSNRNGSQLPVPADRGVVIRDFIVFQVKLAADGLKDFVAINLSVIAIVIDLLTGRGRNPRFFYAVVRLSRRFESWLALHRMRGLSDADDRTAPSPLGVPDADKLIGQFEDHMERKASEMRASRKDPWDSQ